MKLVANWNAACPCYFEWVYFNCSRPTNGSEATVNTTIPGDASSVNWPRPISLSIRHNQLNVIFLAFFYFKRRTAFA